MSNIKFNDPRLKMEHTSIKPPAVKIEPADAARQNLTEELQQGIDGRRLKDELARIRKQREKESSS